MSHLLLQHALLPTGWADDVGLDIEDGFITKVAIGTAAAGRERVDGVVLPGMPNLHSHTFQRGMAGLAERRGPDGDTFWTWRQVMYGFLEKLDPDDVESIAAYAMAGMLEGGFTALAEFHYLHHAPDGRAYGDPAELAGRVAAAAAETGIGLTLLPVFYAHGGFGGRAPSEGQRRFTTGVERYLDLVERSRGAIACLDDAALGIAPHSLRAVTPETLAAVTLGATGPIHIHVAEQTREVEECVAWSGRRPVEWLLDHAEVDARWCAVHSTQMSADETRRLAASGAVAGLCPLTEANLGDGIFPGDEYAGQGGRWGIGSDSNVEISAPAELKMLEYGQRLRLRSRNVLGLAAGRSTGRALYEAALAGGAQATGRRVGAIAEGFRADFVSLGLDRPDMAAIRDDRWLDAYVFVAGSAAIDRVFVGGRPLVSRGRHHRGDAIAARYRATMAKLTA